MAEQFSIPTVGDMIAGKYRVEEELGRGAYGVVFRAFQEELDRNVALKTLLPQAFLQKDIVSRFRREAQLITRLDHPNIIRLFDYGGDEGLLYMAVEFVDGRTLMDVIDNDAPLQPDRVREICSQILEALTHAHAQGIVHRDLKPENIVLLQTRTADDREYEVVKILDFGISKLLRGENDSGALKSLTQDGTVLGTPHYMSPENIVGDPIDHRADLYAFGIILYELLTGEHPFEAPSPSAVMVRHLRDDPPELEPALAQSPLGIAITRSLEKQPWDRIGSAEELLQILRAEDISEIPLPERSAGTTAMERIAELPDETVIQPPDSARNTSLLYFAIGILTVALLVVIIGYNIYRSAAEQQQPPALPPAADLGVVAVPQEPPLIAAVETDGGNDMTFEVTDAAQDVGAGEAPVAVEDDEDAGRPTVQNPPPDARDEPRTPVKRDRPVDKPEVVQTVELDVRSTPNNASVIIDGVPIGSTPLRHAFKVDKPAEIRFTHIGYKEALVRLTPSGDSSAAVSATLEKDHLRLVD